MEQCIGVRYREITIGDFICTRPPRKDKRGYVSTIERRVGLLSKLFTVHLKNVVIHNTE